MAPTTRVGLIGLSSSAKTAWASRAHLPYLNSPRGRSKFAVAALLNSSAAAAENAIATYGLPASAVRAYGDPAALAADPDIDLVVCNTRVDTHFDVVLSSVQAGKDVFVEWPLAHDAQHARVLAEEARKAGGRGLVGLQGGLAPVTRKVRALLDEGRIGKVLSSELRAFGGVSDRKTVPGALSYFLDRSVGGNIYMIGFGHLLHLVQFVLGELASVKGDFHLQRPDVGVQDAANSSIVKTVRSDVPDLIFVSGRWDESSITQQDAPLHYRFRRGQPFPGEPALEWTINGEKGEIRVISPDDTFIFVGYSSPRIIEIHDFETDTVDKVEWDWEDWQKQLPIPARNIGAIYEAFVEAKEKGTQPDYVTFDEAVRRHEQLEGMLAGWNT
ncbi:Galactose/lactose metabolism regulatory protein GAL80 [Madurella mycetomatis]|uniref:Galactose/lactose metabolism regulatory protein GAL80 n=1 Tax=Madurella mycetomatis TaxID=100816 RepID=A0A175WGP3_9PEZI|nr:Galactose/lactose metabolism regulatory protein GAL80 [Madurella mycetomatis]